MRRLRLTPVAAVVSATLLLILAALLPARAAHAQRQSAGSTSNGKNVATEVMVRGAPDSIFAAVVPLAIAKGYRLDMSDLRNRTAFLISADPVSVTLQVLQHGDSSRVRVTGGGTDRMVMDAAVNRLAEAVRAAYRDRRR